MPRRHVVFLSSTFHTHTHVQQQKTGKVKRGRGDTKCRPLVSMVGRETERERERERATRTNSADNWQAASRSFEAGSSLAMEDKGNEAVGVLWPDPGSLSRLPLTLTFGRSADCLRTPTPQPNLRNPEPNTYETHLLSRRGAFRQLQG